jgi:hypothetical protein
MWYVKENLTHDVVCFGLQALQTRRERRLGATRPGIGALLLLSEEIASPKYYFLCIKMAANYRAAP